MLLSADRGTAAHAWHGRVKSVEMAEGQCPLFSGGSLELNVTRYFLLSSRLGVVVAVGEVGSAQH